MSCRVFSCCVLTSKCCLAAEFQMPLCLRSVLLVLATLSLGNLPRLCSAQEFERLQYNNPGLTVDLGVGLWAWPMPMDWDQDGDLDLVVSCPDKPYSGTYFFENKQGDVKLPIFEPGIRVGPGRKNLQVSHIDGIPRVLDANQEYSDFLGNEFLLWLWWQCVMSWTIPWFLAVAYSPVSPRREAHPFAMACL